MNNIKWDRENPYLFLEDWRRKWCKNGDWDVWHRVFESDSVEREMGKTVNNHKNSRKNTEKVLKTLFETQNTHFSWLKWVANKSPGLAAKTLKNKIEIGRSTHEGVASWAAKIPVYPSRLDPALVNKSPKQGNTVFLKIFNFCKNKILSKNT